MRLLLEVLIIGALIYAGWEKSFRDQLPAAIAGPSKPTATATPAAEVIPTPAPQLRPMVRARRRPADGCGTRVIAALSIRRRGAQVRIRAERAAFSTF